MTSTPILDPRLAGFVCLRCGEEQPVGDYPTGCPSCAAVGHAASVVARYSGEAGGEPLLPLRHIVSLGEGDTPLLELPRLAQRLDLAGLWLKAEGMNPTGSHKDRMSPWVVARARMLGYDRVVIASTGNAGVSLAAYAARAGIACTVHTRQGVEGSWNQDMQALGAQVVISPTSFERWRRMARSVRAGEAYPATNFVVPPVGSNAYGVQGYKTLGYELARAHHAAPLDAILVPAARGDLLWGIWTGLVESRRDPDAPLPKMIAVEPFPRASRVLAGGDYRASYPGASDQFSTAGETVTWQTVWTLRQSAGLAVEVGDDEARAAQGEMRRRGVELERCSAAPLAALRRLRAAGRLAAGERVVWIGTADGRREAD